jgi:dynein heavy chain
MHAADESIIANSPAAAPSQQSSNALRLLFCTGIINNALLVQCGTTPGWLDALLVCGQTLEAVQKGLEDYLETKRVAFPRCGVAVGCSLSTRRTIA